METIHERDAVTPGAAVPALPALAVARFLGVVKFLGVAGFLGVVLVFARPDFGRLGAQLRRPGDWLARVGTDAACMHLALAALWLLAAWLTLGLLATLAAAVPGRGGRCAAWLARLVLPRAVRMILAGSTGLGVLLVPVAAGAASHGPLGTPGSGQAQVTAVSASDATALPPPSWPLDTRRTDTTGDPRRSSRHPAPGQRKVQTPRWPTSDARRADAPAHAGHDHGTSAITVRPGDSLWLIAARRLGPGISDARVAAAWPRWYAHNRGVIGDDPSLITPGQVLRAPTDTGKEDS